MMPACQATAAKVAVLEALAEAWNRQGIHYAVCGGIEEYPQGAGRGLEVVVGGGELRRAGRIAAELLGGRGFLVLSPPSPRSATWLFAFRGALSLKIVLFTRLIRGPALFVAGPEPVRQVGPFKVDPWASFAKRVLMPVLAQERPEVPLLSAGEESAVSAGCTRLFGRELAGELVRCLRAGATGGLEQLAGRLRRSSVRRAMLGRPLESLRFSLVSARNTILPFLGRCAPIVALVGPDGVGKSATLGALQAGVPEPFCGAAARHWRPGFLPRPGAWLGRPRPMPDSGGLLPPRRKPGRFHWLRLAYYWIDFTLGHFLKDRPASSRLQVVLYDRQALDMAVDPLRYGLSSGRGVRLLWRLIPKPDLVILLHDQPQRIRSRKPELEEAEIRRQLAQWLRLCAEGRVGAVLGADGGPQDTARAVSELIVEAFIARSRRLSPGPMDLVGWLSPILGSSGAAWYGRVALPGGRQYLLPAGDRKAAVAALRLYRPQKAGSKLAAKLLSAAIRCGPADRLLPRVPLPSSGGLVDHLKTVLGRQELKLGISAGTAGPPRKPVLLLMDAKGGALGYAKIGWNEQTRLLVENERLALDFFSHHALPHGLFPRVIHFGSRGSWVVLVTEPLDLLGQRATGRELGDLHIRFLLEVAEAGLQSQKFGQSGFFSSLVAGLQEVGGDVPSYQRRVMEEAVALMGSSLGSSEIPFVWRLGDFVPWNVAVDKKAGKILAVDLEYAAWRSIPGWDLFHFLAQSRLGGGDCLSVHSAAGRNPARRYFEALRIDSGLIPWLLAAYLASLWLEWARLWSAPGVVKTAEALEALRGKSNQLFLLLTRLKETGAAAS
jgi:hypothetical protein